MPAQFERGTDLPLDPLGDTRHFLREIPPLHQHHELVAAEPRDHVRRPHRGVQPLRYRDEQFVADEMPEAVVHVLEPVEVDKENTHRIFRIAPAFLHRVVEALHEMGPVRQARERVVRRFVLQPLFGVLLFGYVLDLEDQVRELLRFCPVRRNAPRRPDGRAVLMDVALLALVPLDSAGENVVEFQEGTAEVLLEHHRVERARAELLRRVAEYLRKCPVGLQPRPGRRDERDPDRGVVERPAEPLLRFHQRTRPLLHFDLVLACLRFTLFRGPCGSLVQPKGEVHDHAHRQRREHGRHRQNEKVGICQLEQEPDDGRLYEEDVHKPLSESS